VRRLLNGEALARSDNGFGLTVAGSDAAAEAPVVLAGTGPKMLATADDQLQHGARGTQIGVDRRRGDVGDGGVSLGHERGHQQYA
jgi:hypothetical protein